MSLRFHLFVSDVDPGNEDFYVQEGGCKDFLARSQGWKGSP